jgi:hypothetical protein
MTSPRPTFATASAWLVSWFLLALVAGMAAVNVVSCTAQQGAELKTAASVAGSTFSECALLYSTSSAMDPFVEPIPYLEGLGVACGPATVEAVISSLEAASAALPDAGAEAGAPVDVTQAARLAKAHRLARSAQLAAQVTR